VLHTFDKNHIVSQHISIRRSNQLLGCHNAARNEQRDFGVVVRDVAGMVIMQPAQRPLARHLRQQQLAHKRELINGLSGRHVVRGPYEVLGIEDEFHGVAKTGHFCCSCCMHTVDVIYECTMSFAAGN
jgi:hypothetical protein